MKNRLFTISIREIKKSYKRFLSLLIMSFLGVGVFVGLRNTPGTMLKSLDKYYNETNHYDIKIVSTLGLTSEDVKCLNELGTESYGLHSKDVITKFKEDTKIIKIIGLNDNINKVLLNEGTLPKNNNEIVVEKSILQKEGLKIGDYLEIENDNSLKNNKFKIVGVVTSPLYLFVAENYISRGNTNIGTGIVDYYTYVDDDVFDMDYYTEVDISVSNNYLTSSKEYIDLINKKISLIESIKKDREKARYDEIIDKYNIEINQKEEEGKQELLNAENELNKAKNELDNGYFKLLSSRKQLFRSKYQLDNTLNTLNNSQNELNEKEKLLNDAKKELEDAERNIKETLEQYGLTIDDIITIRELLNDKIVSKDRLKHVFSNSEYKEQIENLIDELYDSDFLTNLKDYIENNSEEAKNNIISRIPTDIENYDEIIQEINSFNKDTLREEIYTTILDSAYNIEEIKNRIPENINNRDNIMEILDNYANTIIKIKELFNGIDKLNQGKEEISNNEKLLADGKQQLENGYQSYYDYLNQYNAGLGRYYVGYKDYRKSLNLYNSGLEEYLKNKLDFENEIEKARAKLSEIEMPEWYIYDRSDDAEYSGYINNTDSVKNLSRAFPTVFFIVAIFMCIMSMSRMALEDRGEIGALKSLGFSNKHIMLKYIIYSVIATIIGSILGGLFGFYFLTWFISKMYAILYVIPFFAYYHYVNPFIAGTFISIVCITGTAVLTVMKIVREKPSNLLRPLTPNKGKKILIENLGIWKKVNFSNKITIRNIIRYKKRVIMTIIGIAGCTVLLLTGYGVKDSIVSIADKQFGEIFIFDIAAYLDHEIMDVNAIVYGNSVKNYQDTYVKNVKVNSLSTDLYVLKDDFNYDIINVIDYKTHEKLTIEKDKVIISEKLATINNYKIGDKVKFIDSNNKTYEFEISGISANYVGSYIYMNTDLYEKNFEEYKPNLVLVNLKDTKNQEKFSKELMKNEHVLSITTKEGSLKNIDVMLRSLDSVVLILIVLSGILSFVVLYNLSYINISERKREIATLKVLGFTYSEVDNYIIKENFIITIIGIIIGLILSKPFVNYIVDTVEIELVRFIHIINITSYLYTFIFMILFTLIVAIIIHFTLKKINMIESLKTVE